MSIILGRRRLAVALATGAAALGVAGTALADAGSVHSTTPPAGHGHAPGAGFLSSGLFKTVFGIFGAVSQQTPGIAAPIISQAVTDQTITQAQADQLTALFSAKHLPFPAAPHSSSRSTSGSGTPASTGGSGHFGFTLPAPEELKVMSKVMQAVAAQLPAIAKPVVDAAVTAGDITQSQADLITKVIGIFASFKPGSFAITPSGAASTSPLGALQSSVTSRVAGKAATKHKKSKKHAKKSARSKHATRAKH